MSWIQLSPEQEELLCILVEADRSLPRDKRQEFDRLPRGVGDRMIRVGHAGLPEREVGAFPADLDALFSKGLLHRLVGAGGSIDAFYIDSRGYQHYESIKKASGEPVQRTEIAVRSYLNSARFQQVYPAAYGKWVQAEDLLWGEDSPQQLTSIGHLCREAMQEFADALAVKFKPPEFDPDKAHTVARIRAILKSQKPNLGTTVQPFLDALLVYWGTLSDLVQRQEHGALKEGEYLTSEDARRVVFHAAVVMFELDQSLSRLR